MISEPLVDLGILIVFAPALPDEDEDNLCIEYHDAYQIQHDLVRQVRLAT